MMENASRRLLAKTDLANVISAVEVEQLIGRQRRIHLDCWRFSIGHVGENNENPMAPKDRYV